VESDIDMTMMLELAGCLLDFTFLEDLIVPSFYLFPYLSALVTLTDGSAVEGYISLRSTKKLGFMSGSTA